MMIYESSPLPPPGEEGGGGGTSRQWLEGPNLDGCWKNSAISSGNFVSQSRIH